MENTDKEKILEQIKLLDLYPYLDEADALLAQVKDSEDLELKEALAMKYMEAVGSFWQDAMGLKFREPKTGFDILFEILGIVRMLNPDYPDLDKIEKDFKRDMESTLENLKSDGDGPLK